MLNKLSLYSILIVLQNLNLLRLMGMHFCRILHVYERSPRSFLLSKLVSQNVGLYYATLCKIVFENGFVLLHAQTESCCACIAADLATSFKHTEHTHKYGIGYSE